MKGKKKPLNAICDICDMKYGCPHPQTGKIPEDLMGIFCKFALHDFIEKNKSIKENSNANQSI